MRRKSIGARAERVAAAVSSDVMWACAWGLRSTAAWSMPGNVISSRNMPWPVSNRGASTLFIDWPV